MPKLFVGLILTVVISAAALVISNATLPLYLTALISLSALAVSVVSAFKEDIFPFRPRVLLDELVLAVPTGSSHDSLSLLLPLIFVNEGYGAGVIEGLTLKVKCKKQTKIYTPLVEIDYSKYLTGKRALHAENVLGTFNMFPLESRKSLRKFILFTQEENSKRYPFNKWEAGDYEFRIFIKHTAFSVPMEAANLKYSITEELLSAYKAGQSTSLLPSRELDV